MLQSELEKLNIKTKDGIFTPLYVYTEITPIYENDEVIDYEYIGFEIKITADDCYNEWVKNKDKISPPTLKERTKIMEDMFLMLIDMQIGGI